MRNRRLALPSSSDDEDNAPPPPRNSTGNMSKLKSEEPEHESASENEEQDDAVANPIGEPIRFSGSGIGKRSHFDTFEYDGIQYQLEDPVLFVPAGKNPKPDVGIIKDIFQQMESGNMWVTRQQFYRPEEAKKRTGGNWQSRDNRELFYSFHRDDVPAECVMHNCVVHFIPQNKQIPHRKEHPGFIVQKVYDTDLRRLFMLTDKHYEDSNRNEIDFLVRKTSARLGDIPDIEREDAIMDQEEQTRNERLLRKKNVNSQLLKAETHGSTLANESEYYKILSRSKMLTGETQRDKRLEKLLQSIQFMCTPVNGKQNNEEQQGGIKNGGPNRRNESPNKGDVSFDWPDAAVTVVASLEKAAHELHSADFQKYNQKMRQLAFNLKNVVLARRLLNKELEPAQILNMSPNELKEGLTAEEIAKNEPEETRRIQMTNALCKICLGREVGLTDIIKAGHGDRYQLECVGCGYTWYASRDYVASLTIEGPPKSAKTVGGTAPLATDEFEDVPKNLISPRGDEKGTNDVIKKATEENPATNKAR